MFRRILVISLLLIAVAGAANASSGVEIEPDLKVGPAIQPGGRSVNRLENWSVAAR